MKCAIIKVVDLCRLARHKIYKLRWTAVWAVSGPKAVLKNIFKESGARKMGFMTFKGGVHPHDGKEFSKDTPIRELLPKGELVFPVSQHIGAPASPVVAVGDTVLRGQKIAEAGGFVSAPIYSSVSGTVKAIQPRRGAVGDMVNSIIIENDGEMKEVEYSPVQDVASLSKE